MDNDIELNDPEQVHFGQGMLGKIKWPVKIDGIEWPFCSIDGCENRICLGASDEFCYPHTLEHLLKQQIEAINWAGLDAPAEVNGWVPRRGNWVGNIPLMEEMLTDFINRVNANYVDEAWMESALEIMYIINLSE